MMDQTGTDREVMQADVVIVGAGPSGLAAAIRLKQRNEELSVIVLEKGAEIGSHILSGAVLDPAGLDRLLPDWREDGDLFPHVPVKRERFRYLTGHRSFDLPVGLMPPAMHNDGNVIVSLGSLCQWLGRKAEALGVDIFPGFSASALWTDADGSVRGVLTGDMGLARDGTPGPGFAPGIALEARYTLLAEGARGSLTREAVARYDLAKDAAPQKFGLGLKEVWQVSPDRHQEGLVEHFMGWPLDDATGGGGFLYHLAGGKVAVGMVVHLDYANPFLSPFEELQRFKTHPAIRPLLAGGERISYGARALSEGGWQSLPKLAFPGGLLLGCAAGMVNVPRIKGIHNAIHSGIEAGEAVADALAGGGTHKVLEGYDAACRNGVVGRDLFPVRNVKPLWSRFGTRLGVGFSGLELWLTHFFRGWSPLGTLPHAKADHQALSRSAKASPISYPPPDGEVSFDRLSSVYLSGTSHAEDQPSHLAISDPALQVQSEWGEFGGPSARYCPAGVYEWQVAETEPRFVVNAQNCLHCKTCDIKDPNQNIRWQPPQGGEGPSYVAM